MEIKIARLQDGTTVIGKVDHDTNSIRNVIELAFMPTEKNLGISMMPFMYPFNQDINTNIDVELSKVMIMIDAPKEIEDNYVTITTGIISPNSGTPKIKLL